MYINMKKFFLFLLFVLGTNLCFAGPFGYADIDAYAQNVPPLKTITGLPKLVNYLVKPFKGDVSRARVILAWIVYNINYDRERLKRIADGTEEGDMEISLDVESDPKTDEKRWHYHGKRQRSAGGPQSDGSAESVGDSL